MILKKTIKNIIKYNKIKIKFLLLNIILLFYLFIFKIKKKLKIALCTMCKNEKLYIKEFIDYYKQLGIDNIFIYDDNKIKSEKFSNDINILKEKNVKIYDTQKMNVNNQKDAFTLYYNTFFKKFDWILMVDMDEFLVIVQDTLKNYLRKPIFNKCYFIKINWVIATDNNLLHYENKSLFERFKGPYLKSPFIKTIVRGNINNLEYWVHSPFISPIRNITCNSIGEKIYYKKLNFETIIPINIKNAYIIHFKYKSTEEYINKYKRGYSNWFKNKTKQILDNKIDEYLRDNEITKEKIEIIEKELKINLKKYKNKINISIQKNN